MLPKPSGVALDYTGVALDYTRLSSTIDFKYTISLPQQHLHLHLRYPFCRETDGVCTREIYKLLNGGDPQWSHTQLTQILTQIPHSGVAQLFHILMRPGYHIQLQGCRSHCMMMSVETWEADWRELISGLTTHGQWCIVSYCHIPRKKRVFLAKLEKDMYL